MSDPNVIVNEALAAFRRCEFAVVERLCRAALAADRGAFDAYHLLALAQLRLGQPQEALANCDAALALRPGTPPVLANRAVALAALERYEEAVAAGDRALELQPDSAATLSNRGNALRALGRFDEALASYERALALAPHSAECRTNRALLLLLRGRAGEGWREYEWRRKLPDWPARSFAAAEWRGEDLGGGRLLLYGDRQPAEAIQFCRFVKSAAERCGEVMIEVEPPLAGLMAGVAGGARIIPRGSDPPEFDRHLPLASLPLVLGVDADEAPAAPYITADPARAAAWAERLPTAALRVGIAWRGGRDDQTRRVLPPVAFGWLLRMPGVQAIGLDSPTVGAPMPGAFLDLAGEIAASADTWADLAAVIANLDLVLTADGPVAHLAGALGRPVWVLLEKVPDWPWLLDRADSPLYPTARLLRQRRRGSWGDVMAQTRDALAPLVAERTGRAPPARQKTLVFCTAFCTSLGAWQARHRRWLAAIRAGGLMFDQILIVDDGSPVLPEWDDIEVLREGDPLALTAGVALYHFAENVGRRAVLDFPGWFRSFAFAADFARATGCDKIVHIESDAYLISPRIVDYVNGVEEGWIAAWCKRWNFPETAVQVIAGAAVETYRAVARRPYRDFAGKQIEQYLPFTAIARDFEGDRYSEYSDRVPRLADFAAQVPDRATDAYFWWLAPSPAPRPLPLPPDAEKDTELIRLARHHGVDKWGEHWYIQHYEHHFSQLRFANIKLLEIGIGGYDDPHQGGQSLRLWKDYFPNATIYGLDLHDKKTHAQDRIKIYQGSQDDTALLESIAAEAGGFDIIIDDGSHINAHVIKSFVTLFPFVSDGGFYAVEDLQTSYWPRFGGSSTDLNRETSAMGFFKTLTDHLNFEEIIRPGYQPNYLDRNITAVHFYHNLMIVRKGPNIEGSNHLKDNRPIDAVPG